MVRLKKPYTIGETLVMGCVKGICLEVLGKPTAEKVTHVPLSNDTIFRRIQDISQDMEEQLVNQIKLAKYFSLQLDESTDVANMAIRMVYVRFERHGDLVEEFFSLFHYQPIQLVLRYLKL